MEFAYSNGYQTSLRMSLFQVMYGRICRTPISCDSPVYRLIVGLEMLKEMELVVHKEEKQN